MAFKEVIDTDFNEYAKKVVVNAQTLAGELMDMGRSVVSHGTDNHLLMVDITQKNGVDT